MSNKLLSSLSVIVPAYNEEESLERVVKRIRMKLPSVAGQFEILIINDGSNDGTRRIAQRLAEEDSLTKVINHPFNIGYGGAQKSGILSARYDFLTIIPSDGQFEIDDLDKFAQSGGQFDIVVGCRKYRHQDPLLRRLKTKVFRVVMFTLFGITLRDINWVKLFRKTVFENMEITSRGICVDAEVIFKARLKGASFQEVEVNYLPRQTGIAKGDLPINVIITVIELMILRLKALRSDN